MSTPAINIDFDDAQRRRRLLDEHDSKRRILLNLLCAQCEKQLVFTKCKTNSEEAECIIELVAASIAANGGWSDRWADLSIGDVRE
jgi:hypothetical protein